MFLINKISDDDLIRYATMIKNNPFLYQKYVKSFDLIKNSSKFTNEEKSYLLNVLNQMSPDKSFDKNFIGFK